MNKQLIPDEPRAKVSLEVPHSKMNAFNAMIEEFWSGESKWDVMQLMQERNREKAVESLKRLFEFAEVNHTGGSRVIAMVLASLYNGYRFQVDLTDLRLLDSQFHADVLNVLYLDKSPEKEVHNYFKDGGKRFERMFEKYGLPDREKVATHLEKLKDFGEETLQEGLAAFPNLAFRLRHVLKDQPRD